jgi:hypothetical protein
VLQGTVYIFMFKNYDNVSEVTNYHVTDCSKDSLPYTISMVFRKKCAFYNNTIFFINYIFRINFDSSSAVYLQDMAFNASFSALSGLKGVT